MVNKTFITAEIGINHNGDIEIAKKLIDGAVYAGCDAVKFQKRTVETVYTKEELDKPRKSPWGSTVRDQKFGLEFGKTEYDEIDKYCKKNKIEWFASAWDLKSQEFLNKYNLNYNKIASPMLTYDELLYNVAQRGKHTFISTGMSTLDEIQHAVAIFILHKCPFELMHCNSAYPSKNSDANLAVMSTLRNKFQCDVGYSSHEVGRLVAICAVALGATSIEKHITLDRTMYGSDQIASIDTEDLKRLTMDIRDIETAVGSPEKKLQEYEKPIKTKLRKHGI